MQEHAVLTPKGGRASGDPANARRYLLSALPGGRQERRLALAVAAASALVFLALSPFARLPLLQVWAFLPAYQSALVVNDVVTAVLLLGQFRILRSRALLVLASGYLFSAIMAVAHALSFPGLVAPAGVLGGGPQTTAWLYFLWHGGFPLFVIAYALIPGQSSGTIEAGGGAMREILAGVGGTLALACCLVLLATAGHGALPSIMQGDGDAPAKVVVASASWMLCLAALPLLWRRRPHSVLDLWLMAVMCAWLCDIALAAVLNGARFDLGWYAGRVYGLLAASFVLVVLLLENGELHARYLRASERERRRAQAALDRQAERLRMLHGIDLAIIADRSTDAIAGAVIQPLREVLGVPRAIVNLFDLPAGEVEWLAAAGRRRTHIGPGVRYSLHMMGDIDALARGEAQLMDTHALPPGDAVNALLASGVTRYMVVPMIAGGELIGAISFGGDGTEFLPDQIGIAREVAAQLAIAIRQARLLQRVRQQADDLEQRVRERTVELQAANQELEAFSYSVSHDLRAPLRAVNGFADALMEDHGPDLSEEAQRKIGIVRDEARRMGMLIDDLLAFSRLGRKALQVAGVDMEKLARATFARLSAQHGGTTVDVEISSLPPAKCDHSLITQVWVNLISNAIKFSSKKDKPRIVISAITDDKEHVYSVRDNGSGFDPRYQAKLFGVFQRLHDASEFPGTGVGLALVQRIVVRHGGRVWAESRPGEGAVFHFSLPKAQENGTA